MPGRLPPLGALRAFEAAARHLSFTRAAAELYVTQSAVSQQVKALEALLHTRLFQRSGPQLALTRAGTAYAARLGPVFAEIATATEALFSDHREGILNVSLLATFAVRWLIPRLQRFNQRHPEIEVRLNTTARLVDFEHEDIDLAIRFGDGTWPGLRSHYLMAEDRFPVCSPALLARGQTHPPAAIRGHKLLQVDAPQRRDDWKEWLAAAGVSGIDPYAGLPFESSIQALQAAIAGLGMALAQRSFVTDDLAAGHLVAPFALTLQGHGAYYIVCREPEHDVPKIKAFRDWLDAEAAVPPSFGKAPGDHSS
ncbi:MAG: transcriptional regulator GcvA [Gammaproteobacteria bacterium]